MGSNTDEMLSSINNSFDQEAHDMGYVCDGLDLDFVYSDTDSFANEIAELYSYTEFNEFQLNVRAFEELMEMLKAPPIWQKLEPAEHKSIIMKLLDQLDASSRAQRMQAARCILYLAQGCWAEVQSDVEQHMISKKNILMLYQLDTFATFVDLLNLEIENLSINDNAMLKVAVTLADSMDLRVILSVLYIITETIRSETQLASEDFKAAAESFHEEINTPYGDELLSVKLLGMITRFCSGSAPHFPMKKVLLLLWKISLVSLGGMESLKNMKNEYRINNNLLPNEEDTMEITKGMRASSPPATAADILDNQNPKRNVFRRVRTNELLQEQKAETIKPSESSSNTATTKNSPSKSLARNKTWFLSSHFNLATEWKTCKYTIIEKNAQVVNDGFNRLVNLLKQGSMDDQEQLDIESQSNDAEEDLSDYYRPYDDPTTNSSAPGPGGQKYDHPMYSMMLPYSNITRLPWRPKVRQKDIDQFLDLSRNKFIGYSLIDDHETLAGLPQPIQEGMKTLKRHMYTSLSEIQIQKEEAIFRNPISTSDEVQVTSAEILYQAILPNLPQYMIALLKVLLAASPTSKSKTESINIMADVLPKEMPMTVTQSTKLGIDVNRHKEIIVKAVSAILLLYLKHFKINHIYQFEFMSQHLVFANCIPLVLKFFNQTITEYVGSGNSIPIMDFPSCVVGEQPELSSDSLVIGDSAPYSWRNVFSCINLLRILNKLIKWKHSRVMMLVVFKSAPILKKTLKVRHPMMQLYVLKLLKMQTKYLGRQWRKSNMKTISAIYSKVRHRLNDDWAFGNDLESRPWDFQAEECTLRTCVDRFNCRRYPDAMQKCQTSIAGSNNGAPNNGNAANGNNGNAASGNSATNCNPVSAMPGNNLLIESEMNFVNDDLIFNNNPEINFGCYWDNKIELTEEFKANYELWLEEEVYNKQINWDALLDHIVI